LRSAEDNCFVPQNWFMKRSIITKRKKEGGGGGVGHSYGLPKKNATDPLVNPMKICCEASRTAKTFRGQPNGQGGPSFPPTRKKTKDSDGEKKGK